jgi:hypothetical protein
METLPVAATVSGISFVSSIVFSTSSSNSEIYRSGKILLMQEKKNTFTDWAMA